MSLFHQRRLWLFFVLLFALSCKKDPTPVITPVNNTPVYTQYGTPFTAVPATSDLVMYEINLRSFSAAGDLQGIIARLDNIKALGVNMIWLMPIHPIGTINSVNSPYSVKDYKAVSPEFGTLADLRALTDAAHARGMGVMMDWVANHTAWDNAWISNKLWYTQDASGNIISPAGTNWADVADLNFDNTKMRQAMIDAMKYWILEANVDGYRCDHADGVPYDFWKQALDSLKSIPNRDLRLLAEGSRADHFTAGFDLNYGWDFYNKMKAVFTGQSAAGLYATQTAEYDALPFGKELLRYTTNHDESAWDKTPMVLFNGKAGALSASVVTVFMGGVPLIYAGQEVGRVSTIPFFTKSPINWNDNPDMLEDYQQMMTVYNSSAAARSGVLTNYSNANIVCFTKVLNNETVLVISNMRNTNQIITLPAALQNTTWTNAVTGEAVQLDNSLAFGGYGYWLLKQ